jgi:hypothetical protein
MARTAGTKHDPEPDVVDARVLTDLEVTKEGRYETATIQDGQV